MSRQLYRGRILEHYQEPHNFGEVESANREASVANPHCGDELHLTARVEDGTIEDVKFDGEGCALSIAAASLLTDEVGGQGVGSVSDIDEEAVFDMLGIQKDAIAPVRVKCVLLGKRGLDQMVTNDDDA